MTSPAVHRFGDPERHADNDGSDAPNHADSPNLCTPAPQLDAHVVVHRADFTVDVELTVAAGRCLAVLGHNGAGKSTLLHAIAGLLALDDGHVRLGDRELEGHAAVRVLPQHRQIGLLDQKPRLFPHLDIVHNVAFGPRSQGINRRRALAISHDWLERIGLAHRAASKPHQLSGGQQQRVAIARAFAAEPQVLLLDEPFAALDAESAPSVRRMLVDELARTKTTSILVTHDLADAWQLADDCVVISAGAAVDRGAPDRLAVEPRHPFTAALAGYAVVRGIWRSGAIWLGERMLKGTAVEPLADGQAAIGIVAPSSVAVSSTAVLAGTASSGHGAWKATLTAVSTRGGVVRLEDASGLVAELPFADARTFAGGRLPSPGDVLWFSPDPTQLRVLPA
ncbi:sulfate/molybdate ABC transporter ATP-binding protein [Paramicrobacterium chengjingii]|uniref:ATP-binding cassette domain-containing protein n=1 Tax=Paramicrobacterium chengjingii TaxID=2769067 RepID=A0ABX6YFF3_9MICO|nr:ATP-binding cassette domain-containing protein [Microbacterium chengjingii]QPZ37521.1 ATP-binding cassette domain-containing protein [Microbacterium chengjingii]